MIKNIITHPFDDIKIVSLDYPSDFLVTIKKIIFYKKISRIKDGLVSIKLVLL